ncbi:fimbria/pilus outer membrane usher protein [Amantichitinum ursilacus]|uniref:Outer membrane usher protein HtrE n=1 Tax=Amantichitinum ursilacus TaxID=857265 RepID=A0A0N0XK04_9NEIS|nr:fimbria/pilus outer membrane usher protein [Amantichitinum ursilacus]KPC54118.1 Outer membrane usher protein HtrE precursor [Amantichitinum ursilacus]
MNIRRNSGALTLRPLALLLLAVFGGPAQLALAATTPETATQPVNGDAVKFNNRFLQSSGDAVVDVSRFAKGNRALPGTYTVPLFVNEFQQGRVTVELKDLGNGDVQPCFTRELIDTVGVNFAKVGPEAEARANAGGCLQLADVVPGATAVFDNNDQGLRVSVPQAYLFNAARGYVDSKYWDDGITAATLQYNTNVYQSRNNGETNTQFYAGTDLGFNMGPWRLRHSGNVTYSEDAGTKYQAVRTYVQRGITPLKSQLTLGDTFTDGVVFDSFGVRGVQLASDERMLPDSQRGYAPTIRGIAQTNAKVEIRQNGNTLYETTVAPGAFEINDLYPTGYGGDLEVRVTEADGSLHVSTVPYAAAINALRPNDTRFAVAAGQYRDGNSDVHPWVGQAVLRHGFSNEITGYGGVMAAQNYTSVAGGAALNTRFGALAADITAARTVLQNQPNRNGASFRLSYSLNISPTDTNIALAAYRYSTSGFLSLSDAATLQALDERGYGNVMNGIQRGRIQATVNQKLPGNWGNVYFSGSAQDYWNRDGADTQFSAGYNNTYKRATYGVALNRQLAVNTGEWENRVMFNLGLPLGAGPHALYSSTNVQHDSSGTGIQESLTGSLANGAVNYGVNGGRDSMGSNTISANTSYAAPWGTLTANASKGSGYTQVGAGLSGGMVAYGGGLVLAQTLGESVAIIEAEGASGAQISGSGNGARLNGSGKGVATNLTAFGDNSVSLDPKGLPQNVELKTTQQHTAPTAGAVTRIKFETETTKGRPAILRVTTRDGKPLPFAAEVLDSTGASVGSVAQGGRIIARGLATDKGELSVKWGEGAGQQCALTYSLPPATEASNAGYVFGEGNCH